MYVPLLMAPCDWGDEMWEWLEVLVLRESVFRESEGQQESGPTIQQTAMHQACRAVPGLTSCCVG